jgi:hypothetical protein
MGVDALASEGFEVLKDALDPSYAILRSLYTDGVGAQIDADAERVFHEPEVFIASPKQGLEVGSDLQSDLQRIRRPPGRRLGVKNDRPQPLGAATGVRISNLSAKRADALREQATGWT